MRTRIRERPARRPALRYPWSLQPVSRIVGQRPLEFIRRQAWTATPTRLTNGISAVTSLCLVDEASAGGPPLLITGDEDGGVSVQRVPLPSAGGSTDASLWSTTSELRRARLHDSCVNTIKLLPDQRGFVCAAGDGVLSAVATLEVASESDLRRATFALTGHSGFVTDCDTAACGHAVLSSSTDGRMLLWDPVAANKPVASVPVGRPVNSACFSAGDPYALICAPERRGASSNAGGEGQFSGGSGNESDDLVQIWDLRALRGFRDAVPAAVATAFGESQPAPAPETTPMQPPPSPCPHANVSSIWADDDNYFGTRATRSSVAPRTPAHIPSWLVAEMGSPSASPATPLLRRSAWAQDGSDTEYLPSGSKLSRGRGGLWSPRTMDTTSKENNRPASSPTSPTSPTSTTTTATAIDTINTINRGNGYSIAVAGVIDSSVSRPPSPTSRGILGRERCSSKDRSTVATVRDGPAAVLCLASIPADNGCGGCLHGGPEGKSWVPGGLVTWQHSRRRGRAVAALHREKFGKGYAGSGDSFASSLSFSSGPPACSVCRNDVAGVHEHHRDASVYEHHRGASVYGVQVSSDGRGIMMASKDCTVTLWDAQSREVVYRFGHSRLSMRARPILSESASNAGGSGWGGVGVAGCRGDVFAGMTDGEVRAWRVGSLFPNRVYKPARRHEGFAVTCLAASRDGGMFASADSSGKVCVQSATAAGGV